MFKHCRYKTSPTNVADWWRVYSLQELQLVRTPPILKSPAIETPWDLSSRQEVKFSLGSIFESEASVSRSPVYNDLKKKSSQVSENQGHHKSS
jgi:hypothetical protein